MLDCLILGDSIAAGVGQARPACQTVARTGITSGTYLSTLFATAPRQAREIVISLGVNDDPSMATLENLRRLRREVQAPRVTWLLPGLKEEVRRIIATVAAERGDRTLDTRGQTGPDRLHPTGSGYRLIASWTQQGGTPPTPARITAPILTASLPPQPLPRRVPDPATPLQPPRVYTWRPGLAPGAAAGPVLPAGMVFLAMPSSDYHFRAFYGSPFR